MVWSSCRTDSPAVGGGVVMGFVPRLSGAGAGAGALPLCKGGHDRVAFPRCDWSMTTPRGLQRVMLNQVPPRGWYVSLPECRRRLGKDSSRRCV